jgi:hypothetical protein
MARMIPPHYSDQVKSSAEKQIFELLANDPNTSDWVCLHSLGLAKHTKQLYGEIDFVVMVPGEGIFCLEVKGGRVVREEGLWVSVDRYDETHTSPISPFRQAWDGMHSLLNAVQDEFGKGSRLSRLAFGCGVMFPHTTFRIRDPEYHSWQVYDSNSGRDVHRFIRQISKKFHERYEEKTWYDRQASRPTRDDIDKLLGFLRGNFDRIEKPSELLESDEAELLSLTKEQYRLLDTYQDNERCLFQGGAGTGKTLLAVEAARRSGRDGKRVLLVCFNKFLARSIAYEVNRTAPEATIVVDNFHNYLEELISKSSLAESFDQEKKTGERDKLFQQTYPEYALSAIKEGVVEHFDHLVMDEGQDLICPEYLLVLDALLAKGLSGGCWTIFSDFHKQAIFSDRTAEQMEEDLNGIAPIYARGRLMTNCRNTKHIGEDTALISGFDEPPFLPSNIKGVPVKYLYFEDEQSQRKILRNILRDLTSPFDGVPPEKIVILSPYTRKNSCLANPLQGTQIEIESLEESSVADRHQKEDVIYFSTIHAFKGLESSIIIIVDVKALAEERIRQLLYVGMSRARHRLYVLISESARDEFEEVFEGRSPDNG